MKKFLKIISEFFNGVPVEKKVERKTINLRGNNVSTYAVVEWYTPEQRRLISDYVKKYHVSEHMILGDCYTYVPSYRQCLSSMMFSSIEISKTTVQISYNGAVRFKYDFNSFMKILEMNDNRKNEKFYKKQYISLIINELDDNHRYHVHEYENIPFIINQDESVALKPYELLVAVDLDVTLPMTKMVIETVRQGYEKENTVQTFKYLYNTKEQEMDIMNTLRVLINANIIFSDTVIDKVGYTLYEAFSVQLHK